MSKLGTRLMLQGMNFMDCRLIRISVLTVVYIFTIVGQGMCDQSLKDTFNKNPENRWLFFADTVMGGKSSGKVEFKKTGLDFYAKLSGSVTTENNGGFIQIRRTVSGLDQKITGVGLKVKGNNQAYHVFLRTTGTLLPWQYYQASFFAEPKWATIKIPIANFKRSGLFLSSSIDPRTIKSIGLVAFGRDFEANLSVSEVAFY